jgi:hypothetical protein
MKLSLRLLPAIRVLAFYEAYQQMKEQKEEE